MSGRFTLRRLVALALALAAALPLVGQVPELDPAAEEDAAAEEIAAEVPEELATAAGDAELAERLGKIYRNLGLADVAVEVGFGVVHLEGTVEGQEAREKAAAVARRQEGVLAVDNDLVVERDLRRRLQPVREKLTERFESLVTFLPLLLVGLAILVLFWLLSRLVGRLGGLLTPATENRFLRDLLQRGVQAGLILVGVLLALEVMEATALVGAVLGTAGLIGLAIGFAFRDMAENTIASVLLSLRQPFSPGDHVVIDDREGKVARLTSRATVLMTLDGNHLRIPNADVFKGTILNYSRNPQRRFELRVGVGVEEDLRHVRDVGTAALAATRGVLAEPPPQAIVQELGDWSVVVAFYGWVDQREVDFLKTRSEALRRLKEALDAAGVLMPEPTYRMVTEVPTSRAEIAASPPATVEEPRPSPSSPAETTHEDVAPERHLDATIAEERRREGDLLDSEAPTE